LSGQPPKQRVKVGIVGKQLLGHLWERAMSIHNIDFSGFFSDSVSRRVKHNLSKQHLGAAAFFASEARGIEAATSTPDDSVKAKHRAHVTAAVLCSVAFLEASINELHLSARDQDSTALPTFDSRLFQMFGLFWEQVEMYPTLKKHQVALVLAGKDQFDRGTSPYQEAEALVKLRDCLIHYKPEWDDETGHHQKLEDRLRNRFALNPYAAAGALWFPHRCLGAGCAEWSVATTYVFSDDFCSRLQIPKRTA
jgi:hypothetical protein